MKLFGLILSLALALANFSSASAQTTSTTCGTIGSCPPATTPLTGAEQIPCTQNGATKRCSASSLGASSGSASVAALRTLPTAPNGTTLATSGYYTAGDGGGSSYVFNASSICTDDGFDCIAPTGAAVGRWIIVPILGQVSVKQAGAKVDGATTDSAAWQIAVNWTAANHVVLVCPGGTTKADTITIPGNTSIVGPTGASTNTGCNISATSSANNIFILASPVTNSVRLEHFQLSGGNKCIWATNDTAQDLWVDLQLNCTYGIYVDGQYQTGTWVDLNMAGGQYGVYISGNTGSGGETNAYINETTAIGTIFSGQSVNAWYDNSSVASNNVTIIGGKCTEVAQHGFLFTGNGGTESYKFVGLNGENCGGFGGPGGVVTGTINAGSTTLTLSSATTSAGYTFVNGSSITVAGAGNPTGTDLTTTISTITGVTATLAASAFTGVSNAEVTAAQYDTFHFNGANNNYTWDTVLMTSPGGGEPYSQTARYFVSGGSAATFTNVNTDRPAYGAGFVQNWNFDGGNLTGRGSPSTVGYACFNSYNAIVVSTSPCVPITVAQCTGCAPLNNPNFIGTATFAQLGGGGTQAVNTNNGGALQLAGATPTGVTFDAKISAFAYVSVGTTLSSTNMTVGTGSNRCLVVPMGFQNGAFTSETVTWGSQAMTLIGTKAAGAAAGGATGVAQLWGLVNPASGNQTLTASWTTTGTNVDAHMGAVSFTGCNQAGGSGTFYSATGANSASSTTPSVTIVSATGDMAVDSAWGAFSITGPNSGLTPEPTAVYVGTGGGVGNGAGSYAAGASSVVFAWTLGSADPWADVAIGVRAVAATVPAMYVASTGSDSAAGTLAAPFLTIQHALSVGAAAGCATTPTGPCQTYVRAGTFSVTSSIQITHLDNGQTVGYYPPDGVNTAIFDGGGNGTLGSNTGVAAVFQVAGASNFTMNGLKVQNFDQYGVQFGGGPNSDVSGIDATNSTGLTFENMDIGNNTYLSGSNSHSGCLFGTGIITVTTISHNYCHNLVAGGILLLPFDSGDTADGSIITGNAVINGINSITQDIGDIYVSGHGGHQNTTGITITNNYTRDRGAANQGGATSIYCDDNCNLLSVTGNFIGAPKATASGSSGRPDLEALEVHNGHNVTFTGNIVDLGFAKNVYEGLWFQDSNVIDSGMAGQVYSGNIIAMNFTGSNATSGFNSSGQAYAQETASGSLPSSSFTIADNAYFNYGGGSAVSNGPIKSDSAPQTPTSAQLALTCPSGVPLLGSSSTALGSPVNFVQLVGGWGPPNFVIPTSSNCSP